MHNVPIFCVKGSFTRSHRMRLRCGAYTVWRTAYNLRQDGMVSYKCSSELLRRHILNRLNTVIMSVRIIGMCKLKPDFKCPFYKFNKTYSSVGCGAILILYCYKLRFNNWIHLTGRRSAWNSPAASAQEVGRAATPAIYITAGKMNSTET